MNLSILWNNLSDPSKWEKCTFVMKWRHSVALLIHFEENSPTPAELKMAKTQLDTNRELHKVGWEIPAWLPAQNHSKHPTWTSKTPFPQETPNGGSGEPGGRNESGMHCRRWWKPRQVYFCEINFTKTRHEQGKQSTQVSTDTHTHPLPDTQSIQKWFLPLLLKT